jgi:hypothetical protein
VLRGTSTGACSNAGEGQDGGLILAASINWNQTL